MKEINYELFNKIYPDTQALNKGVETKCSVYLLHEGIVIEDCTLVAYNNAEFTIQITTYDNEPFRDTITIDVRSDGSKVQEYYSCPPEFPDSYEIDFTSADVVAQLNQKHFTLTI